MAGEVTFMYLFVGLGVGVSVRCVHALPARVLVLIVLGWPVWLYRVLARGRQ